MVGNLISIFQKTRFYKKQVKYRCNKNYIWLKAHYQDYNDKEINEIMDYIEDLSIADYSKQFYYSFCSKYEYLKKDIYFDERVGLFYACVGEGTVNKRLYFAKSIDSCQKAYEYYRQMAIEQNIASPHCYLSKTFCINSDDILCDLGAADGNLSLSVIEHVKKVYLFECEKEWIDALKLTFEPYKDKVEIVDKYVSSCNRSKMVSLDSFFKNREDDHLVLKVDIEGAEMKALKGARRLIEGKRIKKIAVCAYHKQNDEKHILKFLKRYDYQLEYAHGYIMKMADFFSWRPFYRRGVLRITLN